MSKPVTLLIIGAGGRGTTYARYAAEHPDRARVVGVAEPREFYRENLIARHQIPAENVFLDWRDAAARARFADAVVIATQDRMHRDPALAFADLGYDMLLEKPMAPTAGECREIVDAVKANDILFAVCHVMRYTRYTQQLKALLDAGAVGQIVSVQHLEPVGYWHQAHSFVRGNWRNTAESGPMLLTKSCHDLDWLHYVVGAPCSAVSSFGTLSHFRREQQPPGAADRCLDCAVEPDCPYSAKKIYLARVRAGHSGWPADVITTDRTEQGVLQALREGPYGRCVYACDNDVVDHQVVALNFAGGQTATFTMTAFTEMAHRKTRIFGTRGQIEGDGRHLTHTDFLTDETRVIDTEVADGSILGGHGGGDYGLMRAFIRAVAAQDRRLILSGPDETLASHLMVFAAEEARREGRVVQIAGA